MLWGILLYVMIGLCLAMYVSDLIWGMWRWRLRQTKKAKDYEEGYIDGQDDMAREWGCARGKGED